MLLDVSPVFLLAALSVLGGITLTAKSWFDARMADLEASGTEDDSFLIDGEVT